MVRNFFTQTKSPGYIADPSHRRLVQAIHDCRPALTQYAFKVLGDREEAQDVVQETVLHALRSAYQFDFSTSPMPWLHRICQNCCTDVLRQRLSNTSHMIAISKHFIYWQKQAALAPSSSSDLSDIALAINELPEMNRQLLLLHHIDQVPLADLAALYNLPLGTIKSWLNRSRKLLKIALLNQQTDGLRC